MRRSLVALILVLAACGSSDSDGSGAVPPGVGTFDAPSATATPPSTTASDGAGDCDADQRTLEVAAEAFYAENGRYPTSQDELVGDFIRVEITSHQLGPDGEVVRVPDAPCTDYGDEPEPSEEIPTVAELLDQYGDEWARDYGGTDCAREFAMIVNAGSTYVQREGAEPETLDDLTPYLSAPIELWVVEDDELLGAPGSPCSLPDDPMQECRTGLTTLEVAVEAYQAMFGEPPADQQALVGEMLREAVGGYTVTDGRIEADPDGPCAEFVVDETG